MITNTKIRDLAEKLRALRQRDTAFDVFGAHVHRYRCTPVSARDIERLEAHAGAELPADYRDWLVQIGWGAGPDYGLFSPQQIFEEDRSSMRGLGGDVEAPETIRRSDVAKYIESVRNAGTHVGMRITSNSFRGAIAIGHQGCNGFSHLVLAGEMRGTVFGECGDIIGEPWTAAAAFWPTKRDPLLVDDAAPLAFLNWLEHWLDRNLTSENRP